MNEFDPSTITQAERGKIRKLSKRNLSSEIALILSFGFAVLMIVYFWFGDRTFLPLAETVGAPPTVVWFGLSASSAIFLSVLHYLVHRKRISSAAEKMFLIHVFDRELKNAEVNEKISKMAKDADKN